jgi:protein-S-isoprenylcysteine O-methyltransferase Ste14
MSRVRIVTFSLVPPAVAGTIIFVSAGRWDLPFVWGVLGVAAVFCLALAATVDPGLVRERVAPGPGDRDRLTRHVGTVLILLHWVLVGLDLGRLHWTPIPEPVRVAGLVGYALAMAFQVWVMTANPFYSSAVRVQTDRGHYPVTGGPYRLVRHPGYAATLVGAVTGGLALGSWVALLPLAVLTALFVRRTLLEDRMLLRELPGYDEYARRVRYRLLVGVF